MEQNIFFNDTLLLTVEEVGRLLKISRAKAYQLVHQENFPIVRMGSCIRVNKTALIQWIENNTNITG